MQAVVRERVALDEQVELHAPHVPISQLYVQLLKSEIVCEAAGLVATSHEESATVVFEPSRSVAWQETMRVCTAVAEQLLFDAPQLPAIH